MLIQGCKPCESIILYAPGTYPITILVTDTGIIGIDAPKEVLILNEEFLKGLSD